jgi:hypothetical protein
MSSVSSDILKKEKKKKKKRNREGVIKPLPLTQGPLRDFVWAFQKGKLKRMIILVR